MAPENRGTPTGAGGAGLRAQAARFCIEAFGEPERISTVDGVLYRWRLKTADGDVIRITLDSPEFPASAHFIISDSKAFINLSAQTCRTFEEVGALVERIKDRLRGRDTPLE